MKRLFLASFIFFMCTSAAGKEPPRDDDPNFNALMQKVSEAEWLATYDRIAWASTDSLRQSFADGEMPAMGPDWFCYDDKRGFWHAVYGSYDPVNNRYEQAFHYRTNGSGMLKQIKAKADSSLTNPVSRAMRTAWACTMPIVSGSGITFNQYARQNKDKTISVWLFPALQDDYTAVYGGEGVFLLNAAGTEVINDDSYWQDGGMKGIQVESVPRRIWLDYTDSSELRIGAVFFATNFIHYFSTIIIDMKDWAVALTWLGDRGVSWVYTRKSEQGILDAIKQMQDDIAAGGEL